MTDIIIPVLNEETILTGESRYYSKLSALARIIFVDGGSTDRTVEVARRYGEVLSSAPGRGTQKNAGVAASDNKFLLFLNVDTFIREGALAGIERVLSDGADAGCLTMRINDKGFMFRVYEAVINVRAKVFGIIDGDLGMFVKRSVFERAGGFDRTAVMEDILFSRKLRRDARIRVLPQPIIVSSRKWRERGFGRTLWEYTRSYVRFWTGNLKCENLHS